MTRGVEPELLLWENFGVTSSSKFLRLLVYIVFVFFMLIVCFYIILLLETAMNNASDQVPDIQCPMDIDSAAANIDYLAEVSSRAGDFHCFCKNLFNSEGLSGIKSFMFPFDNGIHCKEWYNQYIIVLITIAGIAVLIIVGNVAVETIIQQGAQFTRPVNEQRIVT